MSAVEKPYNLHASATDKHGILTATFVHTSGAPVVL